KEGTSRRREWTGCWAWGAPAGRQAEWRCPGKTRRPPSWGCRCSPTSAWTAAGQAPHQPRLGRSLGQRRTRQSPAQRATGKAGKRKRRRRRRSTRKRKRKTRHTGAGWPPCCPPPLQDLVAAGTALTRTWTPRPVPRGGASTTVTEACPPPTPQPPGQQLPEQVPPEEDTLGLGRAHTVASIFLSLTLCTEINLF
ncbi:unnamed protein product, partial [Gulo gulo]